MTHLNVGDEAPDFILKTDKGRRFTLNKQRGKKVVLFFYPKDDTPSCTNQACSLRDNYRKLKKAGYKIYGISPDSVKKHARYREKYGFPFSLLADPEREVLNLYGVWGPKVFMGRDIISVHRTTFLIDEEGIIEAIITGIRTKQHAEEILEAAGNIESDIPSEG